MERLDQFDQNVLLICIDTRIFLNFVLSIYLVLLDFFRINNCKYIYDILEV
jgi:hypothetical protein